MPQSMAGALLKQCSRGVPHASNAWTPSRDQLSDLESHLPQLSELAARQRLPQSIGDPKASFRQYVGIVVDHHRYIYINAIAASDVTSPHAPDPHVTPMIVCDGGSAFWGALYDPESKTFSQLDANGAI
ncbi:hypothetical protein [Dyella japonica]|nr:hypothetical protein [Dyella japonica]